MDKKLVPVYDIVNCGPRHRFWANGKLVHNSDGINMQNINRNTLVTNDTKFGTYVFYDKKADRVVNANQGGKVYLAKHGLVDNNEELLHQFGLRDSFLAPKGKTLVCFDLSQVECVSGDGLVLTDNGIKKMYDISYCDKVWDGVEYVKHDGVVFKGVKDVIEYNGIVGTPDHIVYKRDGTPISLDQAAFSKAELLTGGDEWEKIWQVDSDRSTNTTDDEADLAVVRVSMRCTKVGKITRPTQRFFNGLRKMWECKRQGVSRLAEKSQSPITGEVQRLTREGESEQTHKQNVCRRGEQVQFVRGVRPLYVEYRSERRLHRMGARQDRYKWSLRKRKLEVCYQRAKRTDQTLQCDGYLQRCGDVGIKVYERSCITIPRRYRKQIGKIWSFSVGDHKASKGKEKRGVDVQGQNLHEMGVHNGVFKPESETTAPIQSDKAKRFTKLGNVIVGTIPVYDIINCGPRHRFCYNGSVVSNCRMNAWLWGEMWVLDALTSGKDIYKVTAAGTYQVPYEEVTKSQRFVGKSQVLGLGYGAGVNGLKVVMGKRSEEFTDDQLQSFVDSYRKNAPNIRNGWKSCTRALDAMMSGQEMYVDAQGVTYTQGHKIILPNGLGLTYRDIHIQRGVIFGSEYVFWGKDKVTKKPGWEKTFGGKIDENLCVDGDALVLVKRGNDYKWVSLRNVELSDLVFDGVDFVTHSGVLYKSIKPCVLIDGVYMTEDHEVLTSDGWKEAGLLLSERSTSSIQRLDWATVREINRLTKSKTKKPKASYSGEARCEKEVYDVLNCGPRNRFVVLGNSGAFIVHNCQALCRIVLAEQMANIKQDFIDRGWSRDDAHICMQVHDEVITCCREDIADDVAKIMKQRMKESPQWCKTLPLDCDGDIARRYGCAK